MWLDLKRWHFLIGRRFGGKAPEWLDERALWIRRLEVCASPTSGFAQDKWGAPRFAGPHMRDQGRALRLCPPSRHPAMSHLASSHLVQKRSLTRPTSRKADGPSPKDTSFWAPLMYIVGSRHQFESLCEQSSAFGYPGIPAQQVAASSRKGGILRREEKVGTITPSKQHSSVHFFPKIMDSSSTLVSLSCSLSQEMPISFYQMPSAQDRGFTLSSGGPLTSKTTVVSCSHKDSSLGKQSTNFMIPKRPLQPSSDLDTYVLGDGEDYFLSLFGESKKLPARTSQAEAVSKHLSVILEEVGQFTSSSLGDIKIAEVNVKGFFVRLSNSSNEKEVEIGNHILQQNVNGHAVSLYRFPHNVTLQASSTVTVWAAASEAKPQPPTDFVWDEQSRFRSSPDCTTILCNPSGEAIAWYTPIHWKQAWEKLETDIEFERCSVVIPSMRSHMFGWTTASVSSISKEKEEPIKKTPSQVCSVLVREKEIPPTVLPNKSPWCRNPNTSPHPYSSLIDSHDSDMSESSLGTQLKLQSTKPKPDPGTKKKKSKS